MLCANVQVPVDLIGYAVIDRKQARFIELRFANQQRRLAAVVIAKRQPQQLSAPDSRGE